MPGCPTACGGLTAVVVYAAQNHVWSVIRVNIIIVRASHLEAGKSNSGKNKMNLISLKKRYYDRLDSLANEIGDALRNGEPVSAQIMEAIVQMYDSAKTERDYECSRFECAYHTPITGEFEFLVARILYHYSEQDKLGWRVFLRRQVKKTVPDIRITNGEEPIGVIEIKSKGGWIQPFFSEEKYRADKRKLKNGQSDHDPDETIIKLKGQITKYEKVFSLKPDDIFYILPTLAQVHKNKYHAGYSDYRNYFSKTSGLPESNFVLLSSNLTLDLSNASKSLDFVPTDNFETMVASLRRKSNKRIKKK